MAFKPTGGGSPKYVLGVDRFKGVDLAGNPTSKSQARADFALNMITDGNGYPETRHGYEKVIGAEGRINGIYSLQTLAGDKTLVHHGTKLSEWANGTLTELYSAMADEKSTAAQMDNKLVILDGKKALVYANWGDDVNLQWGARPMADVAYVPTTIIGAKPGSTPGGTAYENINLISGYQYNSFLISEYIDPREKPEQPYSGPNPKCRLQLSDAPVSEVTVERRNNVGTWDVVTPADGKFTINYDTGTVDFSKYNGNTNTSGGLYSTNVTGQDNYRVKFASSHSYNESVSDNFDDLDSIRDRMYLCAPKGNWFMDNEVWMTKDEYDAVSDSYYGLGMFHYRLKLRFSDVDFDKPIYLNIKDCSFNTISDKERLLGRWELTGISDEYQLPYGKAKVLAYMEDSEQDASYKIRYKITKTGGECAIDLIVDNGALWYAGGSFTFYGGYWPLYRVSVEYQRIVSAYPDRVNYCTILQKYGYGGNADRLFISGNPALPNYDFWSGINDPTYFPDLNYAQIGDENTAIMGYSWLSDGSLAIHKEWDGEDSTIYIRKGDTFNGQVVFTLTQGAVGLGVVSSRCGGYMNGDPLQLSSEGVFATIPVGNTAINERYAQNRSYFVNPLLKKQNLKEAEAIVHKGKYYLAAGDYVFVADGDQRSYSYKGDQSSYEWYLWDNVPARIWWSDGDRLFFGDAEGNIYMFNDGYEDNGEPVKWEWLTPWLDFGRRTYYKKVKNVTVLAASRLGQDPVVEYRFPRKDGKHKIMSQVTKQDAPFLKGTNYKAKKISLLQLRISGEEAFGLSALSILYTVSGKFKE